MRGPMKWNWEAVASVGSGMVAALALATSAYTVYLQRQQVRAEVWPFLEWSMDFDGNSLVYSVNNRGMGPAAVKRLRVVVDGKPEKNWVNVVCELLHTKSLSRMPGINLLEDQVLSPGQEIHALTLDGVTGTSMLLERQRMSVELCYCSSLNECWQLSAPPKGSSVTTPVPACTPDTKPFESLGDDILDQLLVGIAKAREAGTDAPDASPDSSGGSRTDH
jgi:hypothetical protein